jgi:hypothetical protein
VIYQLTGKRIIVKVMLVNIEGQCKVDKADDLRTWVRVADKAETALGEYGIAHQSIEDNAQEDVKQITRDSENSATRRERLEDLQVEVDAATTELNESQGSEEAVYYLSEHEYGMLKQLWNSMPSMLLNRKARATTLEIDDMITKAVKGDINGEGKFVPADELPQQKPYSLKSAARRRH